MTGPESMASYTCWESDISLSRISNLQCQDPNPKFETPSPVHHDAVSFTRANRFFSGKALHLSVWQTPPSIRVTFAGFRDKKVGSGRRPWQVSAGKVGSNGRFWPAPISFIL